MSRQTWKPGTLVYPLPAVMVTCKNNEEEKNKNGGKKENHHLNGFEGLPEDDVAELERIVKEENNSLQKKLKKLKKIKD